MRFWTREIAGWLSLLLGVFGFYVCYVLLMSRAIIEAGPMTVISIFLFRGGIQLLKMATAARICLEAQRRVADEKPARTQPEARAAGRPATTSRRPEMKPHTF